MNLKAGGCFRIGLKCICEFLGTPTLDSQGQNNGERCTKLRDFSLALRLVRHNKGCLRKVCVGKADPVPHLSSTLELTPLAGVQASWS